MNNHYQIIPAYIPGTLGNLFTVHYSPCENTLSECFIGVPSFAEEMNRCRYSLNMLAQALTAKGIGYLSVDPFGSGDSAGEFGEATWQQWVNDIVTTINYAKDLGYHKISLIAVRLGALLAVEAINAAPDINRLVLWQPVVSGKVALNQFLRIKIAASISREEAAGTTAEFEEQINRGENLEVAGYSLSPGLFKGIQAASLSQHQLDKNLPVYWFTVLPSAERKIPRGEQQLIEKWLASANDLYQITVIGEPFWQAHERTLAPELVEATLKHLAGNR